MSFLSYEKSENQINEQLLERELQEFHLIIWCAFHLIILFLEWTNILPP